MSHGYSHQTCPRYLWLSIRSSAWHPCSQAVQILSLNENTWHFPASPLTSCEIYSSFPLTSSYITVKILTLPSFIHWWDTSWLSLTLDHYPALGWILPIEDGAFQAGYAITDQHTLLEYRTLPNVKPAQETKLITVTQACIKAEGIKVNIYVDGCCAFREIHDLGTL